MKHNMKGIQSKFHRIGTYYVCKISFSCLGPSIKHVRSNNPNI